MLRNFYCSTAAAVLVVHVSNAWAAGDAELQAIREQVQQLEQRIGQQSASTHSGGDNAFNPAISLVLSGIYGQFQQSAALPATGFALNANNTGYTRGFALKESELGIAASIDPLFRGVATFALDPVGGIAVENGFVQTSALGEGFNLKFGRFFSGFGYLNEQHAHAWDFVDQPLVYRVLWDNQYGDDGVQLKWLAPTDMFIELGVEAGRGRGFPGSNRDKNGAGATALYLHGGDDIGIEQSWRAGISLYQTRRENAASTVGTVTDSFSGNSRTIGLDWVWKYSPNGNLRERHFNLQGEYFRRNEDGMLTFDTAGANIADSYAVTQSGWYLQGVYKFRPAWRTGLRYDRLDPGIASVGPLNAGNVAGNYAYAPTRISWMADYSPSEFSRIRLQLAHDNSRQGLPDNQLWVQYLMSLGAHGAHSY